MTENNNEDPLESKTTLETKPKSRSVKAATSTEKIAEVMSGTNFDEKSSQTPDQMNQKPEILLPTNQLVLPVIPIRDGILFPQTESVLTFGRKQSINAINSSIRSRNLVVLVSQKKENQENPKPSELYTVGTLATIDRTLKGDGYINALVKGIGRVKIIRYIRTEPNFVAQVVKLDDYVERDEELKALATHLQKEFRRAVQIGKTVEFLNFMKLMSGVNEGEMADQIASSLNARTPIKQTILETLNVKDRIQLVIEQLSHEMKILEIEKDVANKTQAKFDKHMRESVLRERLRTIQKELGEFDDDEEAVNEYSKQLKKLKAPKEVKDKVEKEIKKLKQMSINNPESGYIRSWLDTIFELPWGSLKEGNYDLKKAFKILEKNHYGLPKVKDRILEFIAVLQLKQQQVEKDNKPAKTKLTTAARPTKSNQHLPTILCFVGPPGVGKTSIGRSVAEALGREFVKVSLGGVRDEADIRGHRRTYVGAMPGRIISGMKQAKSMNPVFMLDEVDKLGNDFRGDPSAALLEALDPEQNFGFEDHYLDVPFDLSQALFITTANTVDTIPPALRDRLEIIEYTGYSQEEKLNIAKNYLLEKAQISNGLKKFSIEVPDKTLEFIITRYTREAGVRNLERNLHAIMRKTARKILESPSEKEFTITTEQVKSFLGPEKFDETLTEQKDLVGLATGLAWTSVGGDVLFIEVALTPGKGQVKLTGKLGDVMKESAQAALTYVKANAKSLGIDSKKIEKTDVHIHVPEGAVPKDGPSAGITITTAIVSAFTNKAVKKDIAMTGEVTLRGRILRIGGLKEKSIAAHRAGSKMVLIPKDNERDLVEIPKSVKKDIVFKPVGEMKEVLKLALHS
jgi:ATP-dependent Lon protease